MALPKPNEIIVRKIFIACALFFEELGMELCYMVTDKYQPYFFHMRTVFFIDGNKA